MLLQLSLTLNNAHGKTMWGGREVGQEGIVNASAMNDRHKSFAF
jgi:hypothetical protein